MKDKVTYSRVSRAELLSAVQMKVKPNRWEHILRVEESARKLARQYGVKEEAVSLAALLHDYAKDTPFDEIKALFDEGRLDETMISYGSEIWHGPVAAIWAQEQFGVDDPTILAAVREHTIGGTEMSDVSKVLFIADYIEPGRSFPGVEEARTLAAQSLEAASLYKIKQTLMHLVNKGKQIYPYTVTVYNAWIRNQEETT